jgi:hypothetical protein
MRISILDRLIVRPGRLEQLLAGLRENYLPNARGRGMTLAGVHVLPPEAIDGVAQEVMIVWTVPDFQAFFAMRGQACFDPSVAAFWEWCEPLLERRERRIGRMVAEADL